MGGKCPSLSAYIIDINAGSRGAYSAGAFAAFEEHPVTGVGNVWRKRLLYLSKPAGMVIDHGPGNRQTTRPGELLVSQPKKSLCALAGLTG